MLSLKQSLRTLLHVADAVQTPSLNWFSVLFWLFDWMWNQSYVQFLSPTSAQKRVLGAVDNQLAHSRSFLSPWTILFFFYSVSFDGLEFGLLLLLLISWDCNSCIGQLSNVHKLDFYAAQPITHKGYLHSCTAYISDNTREKEFG